jgi:hypothetical protein
MRTLAYVAAAALFAFALAGKSFAAPMMGSGGEKQIREQAPEEKAAQIQELKLETIERALNGKSLADGLYMSGVFTYNLSATTASITLDRINNDSFSGTTGTLRLALWATDYEPARGAGITGYRIATFQTFNPLPPRTYYPDIVRSASYVRPPNGTYWLVLVLSEYNPSGCPSNSDGYCLEDSFTSFSQVRWGNLQPSFNYTDMWFTSTESGWGISLVQHPSNFVFGAWFTYDEQGQPHWYVVPECQMIGDYCTGTLYETNGSPFSAPFNPAALVARAVGTLSLTFNSFGTASMRYNVRGVIRTKSITRQPF